MRGMFFLVFMTMVMGTARGMEAPGIGIVLENGHYFFTIPDAMLGRQFLVINRLLAANAESNYFKDDQLGSEKVICFRKDAGRHKITLHVLSYAQYSPDSTEQPYYAYSRSAVQPAIAELELSDGGRVEVTSLVMGNTAVFYSSAASIRSIRCSDEGIEVIAVRAVAPSPAPMEVSSSLVLLPEKPMHGRAADKRIGYFTTGFVDPAAENRSRRNVSLICRWRLEVRPGDREKYFSGIPVEPMRPIVYYIDPATPAAWVPYLIQGVNDWQPVLERAGFKNAIMARVAPAGDSSWSLASCRAAIIYKPSPVANAFGPNIHDPRSGEIIQAHINWYHSVIGWLQAMYMIQAGPSDSGARHLPFDDRLMGRLIRMIACHEVGHTLGLTHNLGASSHYPVEKLRDAGWLAEHGHSPSIMDYSRFNYIAQPYDGIGRESLIPRPGPYDQWAIEWGYRLLPPEVSADDSGTVGQLDAERDHLNRWVMEKVKDPTLCWGDGESPAGSMDPRSQAEDLGDDAVKAGEYGIANLRYVMRNLERWTVRAGGDYTDLRRSYQEILSVSPQNVAMGQFSSYINHVVAQVGGVYYRPGTVEDGEKVYTYVAAARQHAAVAFLSRNLFTTPAWLLDTAILLKTGENPLQLVRALYTGAFTHLFTRFYNLSTAEAMGVPGAYGIRSLLEDLRRGIWGELYTHASIDIYRRNLQNIYISALARASGMPDNEDTNAVIHAHLVRLRREIAAAYASYAGSGDVVSRSHLLGLQSRIDKVLHARSMGQ